MIRVLIAPNYRTSDEFVRRFIRLVNEPVARVRAIRYLASVRSSAG